MFEVATFMMYVSPPGKKTAMKFDVEKIFQETRRTAREYSQQASGRRKFHLLLPLRTCTTDLSHSLSTPATVY